MADRRGAPFVVNTLKCLCTSNVSGAVHERCGENGFDDTLGWHLSGIGAQPSVIAVPNLPGHCQCEGLKHADGDQGQVDEAFSGRQTGANVRARRVMQAGEIWYPAFFARELRL